MRTEAFPLLGVYLSCLHRRARVSRAQRRGQLAANAAGLLCSSFCRIKRPAGLSGIGLHVAQAVKAPLTALILIFKVTAQALWVACAVTAVHAPATRITS